MKNNKSPYVIVGTPSKVFALRLNEEVFVAHLWIKDSTGEWEAMTLQGDVMTLTKDSVYPVSIGQDELAMQDEVCILSCQHAGERTWVVVAGSFQKKKRISFHYVNCLSHSLQQNDRV